MMDAKRELQYRLAIQMLEQLFQNDLLTTNELTYAKQLAMKKYQPQTVWE